MNSPVAKEFHAIPCEVQMTTQSESALLNVDQAADRTGLSISTLAKLRLSGKGPAYIKLGRRVGYRREDLDAWIECHRVGSTSEYQTRQP